jgi:hypothetical protein
MEPIEINVLNQGKPIVNEGFIIVKSDSIVAAAIDMKSKYCIIESIPIRFEKKKLPPAINIGYTAESLYLNDTFQESDNVSKEFFPASNTFIEFPEFEGWEIWCANLARYTLQFSMIKV